MPLIDGKYEIISEQQLGPEQTLFEATAPDGAGVRIVWYELSSPQEAHFEHYRRTVKRLKRSEQAAVFDVVSRPGAHYVAWRLPVDEKPTAPDEELAGALEAAGFRLEDADVRRGNRRSMLYGLAFGGTPLPRATFNAEEIVQPKVRRPVTPPAWLVTAFATLLLAGAAVGLLSAGLALRSNDELVVVPQLSGQEVNEAALRLHRLGLTVDAVPIASGEAAGIVLKSEPENGSQIRPGRTIRLTYALPPGAVTRTEVPRVVARQFPEAAAQSLAEAGLEVGTVSRIPAKQAAGLVISQSPAAGSTSFEGATVDLLLSAGPSEQMTFLPDLVGMPVEEARYLARLAGLRPERILEDEVPAGRGAAGVVLAQSLRPNQPIARDDAVLRLIVANSERNLVSTSAGLPSFVGLPLGEATELAGNLEVAIEEISYRALPEGVVDQTPSATSIGNDAVTLIVNVHPVPIPRPDAVVNIREPEPREIEFSWFVEPGIPEQEARVYATTLEGERTLVWEEEVRGGESVDGSWQTTYPGPVRFNLTLNDQGYGVELLRR
ncbi:MAG: PASTA domain-containing protein [Trueperaceae bacterium]